MGDPLTRDGVRMNGSQRLNVSAGVASVAVALVLVAIKGWALWFTGALSVAASLADSAVDLLASTAGLAGIVYAAKPADADHSFGHSSAEDLVALGQALLITASAGVIGWNAVGRLANPQALGAEELTANLGRVFHAVIQELDRHGGNVIYFSGDAITCWIDGDDGLRAVAVAFAMQEAMVNFCRIAFAATARKCARSFTLRFSKLPSLMNASCTSAVVFSVSSCCRRR